MRRKVILVNWLTIPLWLPLLLVAFLLDIFEVLVGAKIIDFEENKK